MTGYEALGRPESVEVLDADGTTELKSTGNAQAVRVTLVGTGGADMTVQIKGAPNSDTANMYDVFTPIVFAGDDVQSFWSGEPHSMLAYEVSGYVAGQVEVLVQDFR